MHPSFRLGFEKQAFVAPAVKMKAPKPFTGAHLTSQMRDGVNSAAKAAPVVKTNLTSRVVGTSNGKV